MKFKGVPDALSGGLSWQHEESQIGLGRNNLAGVDEAGRGCWAGPVVAGAVIFQQRVSWPLGLNDSKKLNREQRKRLYEELAASPCLSWAVGIATVEEIDQLDILGATLLAMQRAIQKLRETPDFILLDGPSQRRFPMAHLGIVGGDGLSPSIAAASILAKESRDRLMEKMGSEFPGYGFAEHKGYGTRQHQEALARMGPVAAHRRSFKPVRQATFAFS